MVKNGIQAKTLSTGKKTTPETEWMLTVDKCMRSSVAWQKHGSQLQKLKEGKGVILQKTLNCCGVFWREREDSSVTYADSTVFEATKIVSYMVQLRYGTSHYEKAWLPT